MAYENLILLAPCHGIEDFPLYHTGDDAASLLACWTSLFHPTLLAAAKKLPRVERCDYPPENLANSLFVLPKPCEAEMSEDLPSEIAAAGSMLIRGATVNRNDILRSALEGLHETPRLDPEVTLDFLAMGFTLLQVELLTQQMRYSSSIDQSRIEKLVFEAADLALDGDATGCREKMVLCHDVLTDERSHYYPVDVYLLDLTLLAESTFNDAFEDQLANNVPSNIVADAKTISALHDVSPQIIESFKQAVEAGRMGIAGGEFLESPLPFVSPDSFLRQLLKGREIWNRILGQAPSVFARRRSGIYPSLGYAIRSAGFESALHLKFDEGKYPESSQSKTTWGVGETDLLSCLARQPLDANADHTFLDLPRELSDAMDTDFVAARAFWHWPGYTVPWYEDLRRACRYGTALGKFVTLDHFFDESTEPNSRDAFSPSSYSYPYLAQAANRQETDPHSRWMRYWQHTVRCMMLRGSLSMANCLGAETQEIAEQLGSVEQDTDELRLTESTTTQSGELHGKLTELFSKSLTSRPTNASAKTVINPLPFARRILLDADTLPTAGTGKSVYAAATDGEACRTLVDVPAMGFATVTCDGSLPPTLDGPELAEGMTLRNEFLSASIDEVTGAMRSLRDHSSRTTRLSQQLALRISVPKTGQHWVDRQAPVAYSVMAADRAEITANGKVFAEITTQGRMLAPNGEVVGEFQQRFQVTRGSRILNIEIEIQPQFDLLLEDEPWSSYYASRFAFGDESALLIAGRHFQSHEISSRRLEAPLFVEIDTAKQNTTILSGGLPHHRRATANQLDTLLITGGNELADGKPLGESATRFRLGIGVDLPTPTQAAISWMASQEPAMVVDGAGQHESGWLFHVTAKNVLVTSWESLASSAGMRMRLVETLGRRTKFKLHAFKPWTAMQQVSVDGEVMEDLEVIDGVAEVLLKPYEMIELQGSW